MTLARTVSPETLDVLAADDPRAIRSRLDLQRVNRVIGARKIVLRALRDAALRGTREEPLRVLELGAGDGSLMLAVAKDLAATWPAVNLTLLDRSRLVAADTVHAFETLGWTAQSLNVDVLDWIAMPAAAGWDVIVANLFLHHFEDRQLATLLDAVSTRCDLFFACEPRRARLPLLGSHLIGAIGANDVTREDAVLSVHAGFRRNEISLLWPSSAHAWQLQEYSAGLFSHCLRATRLGSARLEAL